MKQNRTSCSIVFIITPSSDDLEISWYAPGGFDNYCHLTLFVMEHRPPWQCSPILEWQSLSQTHTAFLKGCHAVLYVDCLMSS